MNRNSSHAPSVTMLTPKWQRQKRMNRQPENVPDQVKDIRRQLGLSQEDLAHALGVSFATVNRWENGKTAPSKLARRQIERFCTDRGVALLNSKES